MNTSSRLGVLVTYKHCGVRSQETPYITRSFDSFISASNSSLFGQDRELL